MNTKRTYGKAFGLAVPKKPFRPYPQNTTQTTQPMMLYRTPSQFKSLTNPPQGRIWPEKKDITVSGSLGVLGSNVWSELDFLNPCAQGVDSANRIGRKLQLKSLTFRWHEAQSGAIGTATLYPIRIMIVYDRNPEQALPLIQAIVQNNYNGVMNLSNSDRFVILADEIHPSIAINCIRSGTIYKKLNLPSVFSNTGGDITDITTGGIFAMCCFPFSNAGNGIGYTSRVRFTDV
jgi:hypothetical protein